MIIYTRDSNVSVTHSVRAIFCIVFFLFVVAAAHNLNLNDDKYSRIGTLYSYMMICIFQGQLYSGRPPLHTHFCSHKGTGI